MSAEQLHRAILPLPYCLATTSLPEYVATHLHLTDYLMPTRVCCHTLTPDWLPFDTLQDIVFFFTGSVSCGLLRSPAVSCRIPPCTVRQATIPISENLHFVQEWSMSGSPRNDSGIAIRLREEWCGATNSSLPVKFLRGQTPSDLSLSKRVSREQILVRHNPKIGENQK